MHISLFFSLVLLGPFFAEQTNSRDEAWLRPAALYMFG
jgi:hypothetical protein